MKHLENSSLVFKLFNYDIKLIAAWYNVSYSTVRNRFRNLGISSPKFKVKHVIPWYDPLQICKLSGPTGSGITGSGINGSGSTGSGITEPRFEDHESLVKTVIYRFGLPHLSDDMYQEAYLIWVKNVGHWNPTKSSFRTWIRNTLTFRLKDYLRSLDIVPRLERIKESKYKYAKQQLEQQFGCKVSDSLIEALTGVESVQIKQICNTSTLTFEHDNKEYQFDPFIDETGRQLEPFEFDTFTRGLTMDEKTILHLYYTHAKTFKAIGQVIGFSESRVSQVHSAVVSRLRERYLGTFDTLD